MFSMTQSNYEFILDNKSLISMKRDLIFFYENGAVVSCNILLTLSFYYNDYFTFIKSQLK